MNGEKFSAVQLVYKNMTPTPHLIAQITCGNTPAIQKGMGMANDGGQPDPLHTAATSLIAAAVAVCLCVC